MMEKLLTSFKDMADSIVAAAPKVLVGIVLAVVALVVAKVVEKVLRVVLQRVKIDNLVRRAGVDQALQRVGLRQELNQFIPRVVYFMLLFLFAQTAAEAMGLTMVSNALNAFFAFLPNMISAALLMILASVAAPFAGDTVARAGENAGLDFAPALGRIVSGLIFFILGIMAVGQLKIDTEIIRLVTSFGLAGLALAFGISFGLGTREITRNILAGFYARKILRVGEDVEIGDERGVLKAVTPTHTLLEREERTISIANDAFLERISRQ